MRRPFLWPALGLACGIVLGRFLPIPSRPVFLIVTSLLPFLWLLRGRRLFLPLFVLALVGVGILRIQQVSQIPGHDVSHFAQKGTWVSLEGTVDSLPELKEKGKTKIYSFVLKAKNLVREGRFFEATGRAQVFLFNPRENPSFGNRVRMRGRLVLPKVARNPGEFDYSRYLREQGIFAVFEGYGGRSLRILDIRPSFARIPLAAIQRIRDRTAREFDSLFTFPLNTLLKALILGIRKGLPEELRDDFMKTGTSHLVAISGMNITLVAGSIFFLSLWLGLPQKGAAVTGMISAVSYVFLSGAGIPVVRAGWMAGLFFAGLLLERQKDLLNSLSFAFFAILTADPRAFFQVGFQLSFLSVFFLVNLADERSFEWRGDWFQTLIVLIGTFPLCVAYFSIFSWASLVTNLLAIPLFHLGVLGGLAALFVGRLPLVGSLFVGSTSFVLRAGVAWIRFWAQRPWSYSYIKPPTLELLVFYYAALALVWIAWRLKTGRFSLLRTGAVSLWLASAVSFFAPPQSKNFVVTVLATGQNELAHIEFSRGRHWLLNAGRGRPSNQAQWVVAPYLRRQGIRHLEGILLTDFSRRHWSGLATILSNFSVGSLVFPALAEPPEELNLSRRSSPFRGLEPIPLLAGDQFSVGDGAGFRVLDVVEGHIFLLVYSGNRRVLFLPSWKPSLLKKVLPHLKELSYVDLLITPAFGRPSVPEGQEVLSALLPQWVVFTKPNPELGPFLKSLEQEEIPFLFLSEEGALRFEAGPSHWIDRSPRAVL